MPEIKEVGYDVLLTTRVNPLAGNNNNPDFDPSDFNNEDFQTTGIPTYPENTEIIDLIVQPQTSSPNTVQALLNTGNEHLFVNNKFTNSGELSMILKNALRDIDYYITDEGDLIVSGEDAKNYDTDENGNLIYLTR